MGVIFSDALLEKRKQGILLWGGHIPDHAQVKVKFKKMADTF
jgi:hypothetical protein